jgi:hypothetical protein
MGLGLVENKFFRRKWIEAAKAKESGEAPRPEPPKDVRAQSLVSGRDKSLGERAESWVKQRMGQPKPKGKKRRKRRK